MATLTWTLDDGVVWFTCARGQEFLPIDTWAAESLKTAAGHPARVGSLLRLHQEGCLLERPGSIGISAERVADLNPSSIVDLGLPSVAPHSVRVEKHGLLTDEGFRVTAGFLAHGRPVMKPRVEGPFLHVGSHCYTLLQPLFGVVEAAAFLDSARPTNLDERGYWLTRLQKYLPEDALADPYLRQLRLTRADRITVLPFRRENGETGLRVVPARAAAAGCLDDMPSGEPDVIRALPDAREDDFNRYLDRLNTDRSCWAVGAGDYLVVSEPVRQALDVVKRVRQGEESDRRQFISSPQAYLRERIGETLTPEQVEEVFWESAEFGQRVREVGVWEPRVLPFIKRTPERWLPEAMGLWLDDRLVELTPESARTLLASVQQAVEAGRPTVDFNGQQVPATAGAVAALKTLVEEIEAPEPDAPEALPSLRASERIAVLIEDNLESLSFSRVRRPTSAEPGQLPTCLGSSLFGFQMEGYRWLQQLWATGAPGGLLADDMGLGKTLQALAFLAWVREESRQAGIGGPILIVGPTGLLRNWLAEHEKHLAGAGLGECLEVHGSQLRQLRIEGAAGGNELSAGLPVLDVSRLTEADWVLTTYETLRDFQHSFARVRWLVAVFDEAQKIKNPLALMTNAAKAIDAQFTLALTGTPVENSLADLWTITDTVQPGRFGALKAFLAEYDSDDGSGDGKLRELKARLMVHAVEPPPMLRRMKEQCLEGLPDISVNLTRAKMPQVQADAYDRVVRQALSGERTFGTILKALQALRSVSLHPALESGLSDDAFIAASARVGLAIEALDLVADRGEKALVFLESLEMQGALVELLQRRYRLKRPPPIINGSVPGEKRKSRVDDFQSRAGFDVMVLSPRAGGVGLTITEANHVVHLSRWWNPAVEDQATDRVYRIGQMRPVTVHVPLALHPGLGDASFDERLNSLLERKRRLSRELLAPVPATDAELRDLFESAVGKSAK